MGQLFEELKRRNVIRVAVAYLISGWLVLQVADVVVDSVGAPDWVMKVLLLLGLLGLPIVLVFSWVYELTPEGVKREKDVDRSTSITPGNPKLKTSTGTINNPPPIPNKPATMPAAAPSTR